MRIPCPFCGDRDSSEFAYLGDATLTRPDSSAPSAERAFHDYAYLRDNPAGPHREFWHHVSGCRSWLVVTRDTRDHAILTAEFAEPAR
jgi:heterotetrameric sarcosine oxidase delta subunit